MGYAIPAAVAASLDTPERTVVALVGDGGFLMTGAELETAVRVGARLVVIVFSNGLHGTIAMHQTQTFGRTAGVTIGETNLALYARSLGADGFTVRNQEELRPKLEASLQSAGVSVVEVVTDPDLITPTSTLSEMKTASTKAQTTVDRPPHGRSAAVRR